MLNIILYIDDRLILFRLKIYHKMQQIEKETKVAFKYCYWKQDAFPIKFKPTNDLSTKTSLGQKNFRFWW